MLKKWEELDKLWQFLARNTAGGVVRKRSDYKERSLLIDEGHKKYPIKTSVKGFFLSQEALELDTEQMMG